MEEDNVVEEVLADGLTEGLEEDFVDPEDEAVLLEVLAPLEEEEI